MLCRFQNTNVDSQLDHSRNNDAVMLKRITGRVLDIDNLRTLKDKRDLFYPLSLILHNTKPVGHQVTSILHSYPDIIATPSLVMMDLHNLELTKVLFLSCRILLVW